jgi:hypothetical protein
MPVHTSYLIANHFLLTNIFFQKCLDFICSFQISINVTYLCVTIVLVLPTRDTE